MEGVRLFLFVLRNIFVYIHPRLVDGLDLKNTFVFFVSDSSRL